MVVVPFCAHLSMLSFWCGHPRSQLCRRRTWTSWWAGSHPGRGADSAEWCRAWPWPISGTRSRRPVSRPAADTTPLREAHTKQGVRHVRTRQVINKLTVMELWGYRELKRGVSVQIEDMRHKMRDFVVIPASWNRNHKQTSKPCLSY